MVKIIDRLFQYIDYKGIRHTRFEKEIGLSNGYLNTQLKRSADLGEGVIAKIIDNCLDLEVEWLLTGKGPMIIDDNQTDEQLIPIPLNKQNIIGTQKAIPLIPIVEAMAGVGKGELTINNYDIEARYVIPEFEKADFLIRVKGSSMQPKYYSGDIVACKILKESTYFQWGKIYLLDTDQGALIKRLYLAEDKDYITCVSDNKEMYTPFDIPKTSIRSYALVLGCIRQD